MIFQCLCIVYKIITQLIMVMNHGYTNELQLEAATHSSLNSAFMMLHIFTPKSCPFIAFHDNIDSMPDGGESLSLLLVFHFTTLISFFLFSPFPYMFGIKKIGSHPFISNHDSRIMFAVTVTPVCNLLIADVISGHYHHS